jgi:putative ATP-binding cassette transporter
MKLFSLLWSERRSLFLGAAFACLAHTILNIAILNFLGRYATQMNQPSSNWSIFLAVSLGMVTAQAIAAILADKMAFETAERFRLSLLISVDSASLYRLEGTGIDTLNIAFCDDSQRVADSVVTTVNLLKEAGFIIGVSAYLFWLSPLLMMAVTVVAVVGSAIFALMKRRGTRYAIQQRSAVDKAMSSFRDMTTGIKQVKTNRALHDALIAELTKSNRDAVMFGQSMGWSFTIGTQTTVLLYLGCQMLLTFVPLDKSIAPGTMAVLVVGLLVLFGPLLSITFNIRQLSVGTISLQRIRGVIEKLQGSSVEQDKSPHSIESFDHPPQVDCLEIRDLEHVYQTEAREEFALGPINLRLRAGQSLFVAGGNGTGKTTLIKLLIGLYKPKHGGIFIDGRNLQTFDTERGHGLFSTVFADICLFGSLAHSEYDERLMLRAGDRIRQVRLHHVISPENSLLAQAQSCSTGERKRLAFVLTALEDYPIYVFDEYCADQDPSSKEYFYHTIIPELKQRHKLVIVVTHDDRYFHEADILLQLERGLPPQLSYHNKLVSKSTIS